jgi:hypothetical protein
MWNTVNPGMSEDRDCRRGAGDRRAGESRSLVDLVPVGGVPRGNGSAEELRPHLIDAKVSLAIVMHGLQ